MMESPLEVLSRAATMVQDSANDSHLKTKELPTAKWRRDRSRLRAAEYHPYSLNLSSSSSSPLSSAPSSITSQSPPLSPLAAGTSTTEMNNSEIPVGGYHHHSSNIGPLSETITNTNNSSECYPIDMTVTSSTASKPRSPPPPYREPLPGSTYVTSLPRPSVITQAPPKVNTFGRRLSSSSTASSTSPLSMISNRENDSFSTTITAATESISMCDPVIDEHFRRSLGADYMALFGKKTPQSSPQNKTGKAKHSQSPVSTETTPTNAVNISSNSIDHDNNSKSKESVDSKEISCSSPKRVTLLNNSDSVGNSVDDHFAKALGDTWKKLQEKKEINNDKAGEREKDNQK